MRALAARALLLGLAAASLAMGRGADPPEYGRVVLGSAARKAGVPAVGFDHWRHRGLFTCRLCHVDVGFAMAAGATGVTAATNRSGFHCGACHDGKRLHQGKPVFPACAEGGKLDAPGAECRRCHAGSGGAARRAEEFERLTADLPRDRLGQVDWERAEARRQVRPVDQLAGLSIARKPLEMKKEVAIASRAAWMDDILFSHPKHSVWNGCEVCHPEIFPSTRSGQARYSMLQISSGEYCGVCHGRVAFPLGDCERCHKRSVR
jgi:c(7)-type cytochrome triheme protein